MVVLLHNQYTQNFIKPFKLLGGLLLVEVIGMGICSFGTHKNVLQEIKDAFHLKSPDASIVQWEKESDDEWETEFDIKSVEYFMNFLNEGTWKETKYVIKRRDFSN